MGSFTSKPKVVPSSQGTAVDDDVTYPARDERVGDGAAYARELASTRLGSLPPPLPRQWRKVGSATTTKAGEKVRVLQWNVLSQGREYRLYLLSFRSSREIEN